MLSTVIRRRSTCSNTGCLNASVHQHEAATFYDQLLIKILQVVCTEVLHTYINVVPMKTIDLSLKRGLKEALDSNEDK